MKTTAKATYEKLMEQQNELFEQLTKNANTVMELFQPDKELTETGSAIAKEYFEECQGLMDEMFKPENSEKFFEKAPAYFNKTMELNNAYFTKSMEYFQNMWKTYSVEKIQETTKQLTELTQENANAMVEATNASVKVMQESLN